MGSYLSTLLGIGTGDDNLKHEYCNDGRSPECFLGPSESERSEFFSSFPSPEHASTPSPFSSLVIDSDIPLKRSRPSVTSSPPSTPHQWSREDSPSRSEYSSCSSSPEHEYFSCSSSPEHEYFNCVPSREPISTPLPLPSLSLDIDTTQRSSSPWRRSSVASSSVSNPSEISVGSAVNKTTSTPSLLTQEILDIGEDAIARYEVICVQRFVPQHHPFLSFSVEELETYYAAAVDTKNILQLRKALVKADIGDSLELLVPKLSLYQRDSAILTSVLDELMLIKQECSNRQIELNFHNLESLRYMLPLHQASMLEVHHTLFSTLHHILDQKDCAQQVAHHFMNDPSALMEYRLPHFGTSQR